MKKMTTIATLGLLGFGLTLPVAGQVIDDFEAGAFAPVTDSVADSMPEFVFQGGLPTSNVIGGVREALVYLGTGASSSMELDLAGGGDHGIEVEIAPQSSGFLLLNYNGGDPNSGLGAIDLNQGTNDSIDVEILMDPNLSGTLYVEVFDPNYAVAQTALTGSGTYAVPFSYFDTSLNSENAQPHPGDFTQVSSVGLQVQLINLSDTPRTFTVLSIGSQSSGACPADINTDGFVDLSDLAELLAQFGQIGGGLSADINGDGGVDLSDLAELLAAFGTAC